MVIKQSSLSYALSGFALVGLANLSTFGGYLVIPSLIAFVLLFGSLAMSQRQKVEEEDEDDSLSSYYWQGFFAVGGLAVILVTAIYVPQIQFTSASTVTINAFFGSFSFPSAGILPLSLLSIFQPVFFFGVFIIPVAEEQFFRAWITNLALKAGGPVLAVPISGLSFAILPIVISAITFATFHFGNYGFVIQTFMILAGSGAVLAYIDIQTQSVVPSMLAHISNNALAFALSGNILAGLIPQFILPVAQFSPLVFPLLFALFIKRASIARVVCR